MTDILDRILEAKMKGATFSKDELDAILGARPAQLQGPPTPKAKPPLLAYEEPQTPGTCQRLWIMRGASRLLHIETATPGNRHTCTRDGGHRGSCLCACGSTLDRFDQAWQDGGQEGRNAAAAKPHFIRVSTPKVVGPKIAPEEAGARDAAKDATKTKADPSIVECDICHRPTNLRGLGAHKAIVHTEAGAKRSRDNFIAMRAANRSHEYVCNLCTDGRVFHAANTIGIHLQKSHGLSIEVSRRLAPTMIVAKPSAPPPTKPTRELNHIEEVMLAEVDRSFEKGVTVPQLAKAASIMVQRATNIVETLVRDGLLSININGGDQRYFRNNKK